MKKHISLIITGFIIQLFTMAFGRFSYTLILPAMMRTLGFSITQMGTLGMGIVFGYLLNCLFSGILSHRIGEAQVVHISISMLSVALFCLGFFSQFGILLSSSVLLGAGAAGSYIPLVAILNSRFQERGKAYGIVTGGVGVGTMLCGYLIPALLAFSTLLILPFRIEFLFYISTFLFGFSFMGFLTVIFLFISDVIDKKEMAKIFGISTLIHSAGQIISTFLAGFLKDSTGTFKVPIGISLFILLACILLFLVLRKKFQSAMKKVYK